MNLNRYRKLIVSLIGALGLACSQGLIVGTAAKWVAIGTIFATSASVYAIPNDYPVTTPAKKAPRRGALLS